MDPLPSKELVKTGVHWESDVFTSPLCNNTKAPFGGPLVAVNENVVACDMAHVPLDDETLDVAIFSLSLMGSNFSEYVREAYRALKLD